MRTEEPARALLGKGQAACPVLLAPPRREALDRVPVLL